MNPHLLDLPQVDICLITIEPMGDQNPGQLTGNATTSFPVAKGNLLYFSHQAIQYNISIANQANNLVMLQNGCTRQAKTIEQA